MTIDIRFATPDLAPTIKTIIREVWREHFHDHPEAAVRAYFDTDESLRDIDRMESTYFWSGGTLRVAFDGRRVVGCGAVLRINADLCELRRLFLVPEVRRRGLGRRLAEQLLQFAATRGYRQMRLASNKHLSASHALYRALDFQPIPAYEPGGDAYALFMQRAI